MKIGKNYALQTIGFIGMISSIIFLLIELFFSEIILDYAAHNEDHNSLILGIIIIGFFLASGIAIISTLIGSEQIADKKKVYLATLLAFLFNFLFWIILSYILVLKNYPGILSDLSGVQKLVVFPKMIMTFAIYILPNLTLLWLLAGWTNAILYVLILRLFGAQLNYRLSKSKSSGGTFF